MRRLTVTYVIFLFREEISSEDHNYARVFNCFRDVMVLGYFKYLHQSEFCSSSHLIHKFFSVIMLVLKTLCSSSSLGLEGVITISLLFCSVATAVPLFRLYLSLLCFKMNISIIISLQSLHSP